MCREASYVQGLQIQLAFHDGLSFRSELTFKAYAGSTHRVAHTSACEITCPPNTPRARTGTFKDFERNRLASRVSTSSEVDICSGSAWWCGASDMLLSRFDAEK